MEFWEFLIQKEGDRSWLPLESPDVEILEGRYRVVARSSRTNTVVDIRITHEATTDFLPIRRIQKRSGRTNPDGLMVVFPYTRLLPGSWELRCTSDLMADMIGEGWHSSVRLQVLPIESSYLEPAEDSPAAFAVAPVQAHLTLVEQSPVEPSPATVAVAASPEQPPSPLLVAHAALADPSPGRSDQDGELQTSDFPETLPLEVVGLEGSPVGAGLTNSNAPEAATAPTLESPELTGEALRTSSVYQTAAELSEQVVDAVFQDLTPLAELPLSSPPLSKLRSDRPAYAPTPTPIASWVRLSLDQDMHVVQRAQPLILTGQVKTLEQGLPDPAPVSGWRIRLYDPQTAQVLVDDHQPLADRVPPFPFSCTVSLPTHYQTYLLLGELILYGVAAEGTPPVLATQSFSVTTDLHELLEAIANEFSEIEGLPQLEVSLSEPPADPEAKLDFPDIASPSPLALAFQPAPAQPLPPQLRPPEPAKERKSLQLPAFVNASELNASETEQTSDSPAESWVGDRATAPIAAEAVDAVDVDTVETETAPEAITETLRAATHPAVDPPLEAAGVTAEATSQPPAAAGEQPSASAPLAAPESTDALPISELSPAVRVELPAPARTADRADSQADSDEAAEPLPEFSMPENLDAWADPSLDWDSIEPRVPSWRRYRQDFVEPATTPEDIAFRSLNLQERFWTRLQSLATDAERSAWLNFPDAADGAASPEPDVSLAPPQVESSPEEEPDAQAQLERTPPKQEPPQPIGLDAELTAQEIVVEDDLPPLAQADPETHSTAAPTWTLPADAPIPVPQLEITTADLTAGKPVQLIAKLPNLLPRVFIKLWLRDRQTRSLIDNPRWIVDFTPDGFGNLIARTQVTVPYGCLELQLEAIAVEMTTLRESEKVTLTRKVMPANLSLLSLDEFDL